MGRAWVEAPDEAGQGHSRLIGALMALTSHHGQVVLVDSRVRKNDKKLYSRL